MFAIVRSVLDATITLDGDYYVPITAHASTRPKGETAALRYGDYKHSLLEIMFDAENGAVTWLAMPSWKTPQEGVFSELVQRSGVPVIEPPTRKWEGPAGWRRIDCPQDFALVLSGRTLRVLFDDGGVPVEAIGGERVSFLADAKQRLVGLELRDLTEQEILWITSRSRNA